MSELRTRLSSTVLGTTDPPGLARFYAALLGWDVVESAPDWAKVRLAGRTTGLAFQLEDGHVPPSWPAAPGDQQMQLHLDIGCSDLEAGVAYAESLGASQAPYQPQDDVRVMLDPAGHPFCLFQDQQTDGDDLPAQTVPR
jgi:catechol 2,3-dioxygenase-like lactoylglutathione lyase family enzyme